MILWTDEDIYAVSLFVYNENDNPCKPTMTLGYNTEMQVKAFLDKQVGRCVVKSKTAQKGMIELNMEIRLKDDNTDFVNVLADMNGVQSAVLVSYNGDYMS